MKKLFLIFLLTNSLFNYSQNLYKFGNGGKVIQNDIVISPEKVQEIFKNNQEVIDLYSSGRTKKTLGNVLLYGGIGTFGFFVYKVKQSSSVEQGLSPILLIVIGTSMLLSIPIKIGYSNKIRQAIDLMNKDEKNPKTTFIDSTDIIANGNGIGISLKF